MKEMDSKRLKRFRLIRFKTRKSILPVSDWPVSPSRRMYIDPQSQFLQTWNKIFMLSCLISMALDPLFFYIPVIHDKDKCLDSDLKLAIIACVLRSLFDAFYVLHIIFQFHTGFIAPSSQIFGRGETITYPVDIAKRYLSTYFLIDILSILPLPQVLVFVIIPSNKTQAPLFMKLVIFSQYVPRIIRICILHREETRTSGILILTPWTGAAYNLFLYMLASHVVGAFWYFYAIEREGTCWQKHCKNSTGCEDKDFYCGDHRNESFAHLYYECPFIKPDDVDNTTVFNFGMFTDALKSGMVETKDFRVKLVYCFWWGFRSLGSLGQNLQTSTGIGEIIFAVFISTFGLVLFSFLIGNMQRYLQSTSMRIEEMTQMRVERTGVERWMSHRKLPQELRARVRRYQQYKWQLTRGVEEENLLQSLPKDLRRDVTRHFCLNLLKRVPMFEKMDGQLFDALCGRLKRVLYTKMSYIICEGDPVDEMLFINGGKLTTMTSITTNDGKKCNIGDLRDGDFCGEELFAWALSPRSSTGLPISTITVKAQTEVEAFALRAADLKFVASQFRRLHSKQFQHILRQVFKLSLSTFWMIIVNILQTKFYSLQWKTWAACRIQAAWLSYRERKLYRSLHEAEDGLQDGVTDEAGTSKVEHNGERKAPKRLLLLPPKPDESNFYDEDY
nr:cyclic nucleotide-gated ion channel 1 [Quercus suber]